MLATDMHNVGMYSSYTLINWYTCMSSPSWIIYLIQNWIQYACHANLVTCEICYIYCICHSIAAALRIKMICFTYSTFKQNLMPEPVDNFMRILKSGVHYRTALHSWAVSATIVLQKIVCTHLPIFVCPYAATHMSKSLSKIKSI